MSTRWRQKEKDERKSHFDTKIGLSSAKGKLAAAKKARQDGAAKAHAGDKAIKSDVFKWLDSQPEFKVIETAAKAITKQQPIAHDTARRWFKEWRELQSASTH